MKDTSRINIKNPINKMSMVLLLLAVGMTIMGMAYAAQPTTSSMPIIKNVGATSAAPQTAPTAICLATCPTNIGNAITDTNNIVSYWQQKGYSTANLQTSAATPSAIENYWQNDASLTYYNNMGHSVEGTNECDALCFWGGSPTTYSNISASTIQNLNPANGLTYCYDFINSCKSYDNPMKNAFMAHSPEMYIGGLVDLDTVTSSDTDAAFWYNGLILGQSPYTALVNAESAHNTWGQYGYYGP